MTCLSLPEVQAALRDGAIYVDVRSTQEFALGHPAGAVNVPLQEPDEETGRTFHNPDFIRVMRGTFPPDAALLIGCESGSRAARATLMLAAFGFTNAALVRGGFIAWQHAGLPTGSGQGYGPLLDRVNAG